MNKKNLLKVILALVIPVVYILSAAGFNSVSEKSFLITSETVIRDVKDFMNIIFNEASTRTASRNWVEKNLPLYKDSLYYNGIQIYDDNSSRFGYFDSTLSASQIANVRGLMSDVEDRDLKGFYARTKITWLAEAQRLEYEVSQNGSSTVNDGFCYQNVISNTYTIDSNRTVLNPQVDSNNAGWLCKSIYENMQHSDYINGKDKGNWFIKPMMRIDTSDFNSSDTTKIVAIVINNFTGDRLDSIIIKVRNFKNSGGSYIGNYINEYNFTDEPPGTDLTVLGKDTINGLNYGNHGTLELGKVDFKVYWYGLVDVWFDKMTVDDELGNRLFNKDTIINFDSRIRDEVTHFTNEPSNYSFYCDEVVYSQIPCVEYIRNKMKSYNSNSNISFVMSNIQNVNSLRNDTVAFGPALSRVKPKVFFADPYLIPWQIPSNIDFPGAEQVSHYAYNTIIQNVFSSLVHEVNLGRKNVDNYSQDSTRFFVIPQLFGSMIKDPSGEFNKGGNREPTNQEIEAQAMLSLAYDAHGLGWFIYQGSAWKDTITQDSGFVFGLFNPDSTKRTSNIFGQDKWNFVREMNKKISNWKQTIDNMKWNNAFSVHEGANHNFISDVKSYYSLAIPPFSSSTVFEDSIKYWEMGFFDPDFNNPNVSPVDKSKYFMMVNRRCVPNINNDGDLRQLKIKFNSSQLAGFNNWKIIELDSNKVIRTFDKDSNIFVDMGIYQPGEGKLYKLAPVMQEGGTLVSDEEVPGNTSFTCKDTVISDRKNIIVESEKLMAVKFSMSVIDLAREKVNYLVISKFYI